MCPCNPYPQPLPSHPFFLVSTPLNTRSLEEGGEKLGGAPEGQALQAEDGEGADGEAADAALGALADVADGVPGAAEDPEPAQRGARPRERQARDRERPNEYGQTLQVVLVSARTSRVSHKSIHKKRAPR